MSESINPCEICDYLGMPLNEYNCRNRLYKFNLKNGLIMKKKVLVIEFHDEEGNTVKQLSKCPARPEDVMAAMNFLTVGADFVVSVQEFEFNSKGEIVNTVSEDEGDE